MSRLSVPYIINQGIVQGSSIGLQLCIIIKSDVKPLSTSIFFIVYADYITLLHPIACFRIAVIM